MRWNEISQRWPEMTERVRGRWSRLSEQDVKDVNGVRDELVRKIQREYDVPEDEAERQVEDFCTRERCQ